MDIGTVLPELRNTIEKDREELVSIASDIWQNPELAFEERKAAKLLSEKLRKAGFEVERPYAGLETAFRAEYTFGSGGAVFALAAEYDALAGIGHACGHNLSGTASVAAAIACKAYMEKHALPGTIVVLGTPGEEGGGGKVLMLENADCLKGVDAAMMAHAIGKKTCRDGGSTGIRRFDVTFRGLSSHAAGSPEKGLNALDAQILLFNAIGLYRQQMDRDALIHGVILEGGEAANIIPDRTVSRIYIRAHSEAVIDKVYDRLEKMVEGAALMTGTTGGLEPYSIPCKARRPNAVLNDLFIESAKSLGMNVSDRIAPGFGSSDFGDFSQVAPGAHPYFCICEPGQPEAPGHSELLKKYANSEYGYKAMLDTGAVLAACALKVLSEPETREAIRADFAKR